MSTQHLTLAEKLERHEAPIINEYCRKSDERQLSTLILPSLQPPSTNAPTDEPVEKKSKKAMRKEYGRAKTFELCTLFAQGNCPYPDNTCRFSHDLTQYLSNKAPDLPGPCPLELPHAEIACPFGITCRYSTSHKLTAGYDEATKEYLATSHKTLSIEESFFTSGDTTGNWWKGDGSIPLGLVQLPVRPSAAAVVNALDKDVQASLRRNMYDFGRSDDVLAKLSINNTAKKRDRGDQQQTKRAKLDDGGIEPPKAATTDDKEFINGINTTTKEKEEELEDNKTADVPIMSTKRERPTIDFRGKTFLAPLTTVGNLPFRRLCKSLGADITCGEMALATNLLQGQASEWALLKRHPEEDFFGAQICGGFGDAMTRCAQMIEENCQVDFLDINFGCPIDLVCGKGAGSACLQRPRKMKDIITGMSQVLPTTPITLKMRKGYFDGNDIAHELLPQVAEWGASAVTLHGRTREQRYSKPADWNYIKTCSSIATNAGIQLVGNGDVFNYKDHYAHITEEGVATTYIARGALIKPWIFTEIKEQRDWDITAQERLDLFKKYASFGLDHWGSDRRGVESTRKFLLEWMSFTHRYIPVGLLEGGVPQRMNWRPSAYVGRNDLETLLGSDSPVDWIRVTEMLLGPSPDGFVFTPKHKATSYTAGGNNNQQQRVDDRDRGDRGGGDRRGGRGRGGRGGSGGRAAEEEY